MGYSLNEVVGQHHRIFMPKEERNTEGYRQFWKDLAVGRVRSGEFKRINKNGEEVWILASYAPVLNIDGDVIRLMKIAQDITPYKKKQ
jgi:methyl-accepting chemotaxis protein